MKHLYSLDNYSDSYKEFGNKVLSDSRNTLNKLGIKVFPENAVKNDNVDSFVVKNNDDKEKKPTKKTADEPTGNLDHENTLQIADILIKANQIGNTIVLVTHDEMLLSYLKQHVEIKTITLGK